jgi:hypothetical protein
MNRQLEDFYAHLNEAVVTTNDFEEGTKFRKREKVDQFAYCGLNPMYRHYLSFDLDLSGAAFRYDDLALPPPTIITVNPVNTHCHYLYQLRTPVAYHANSRVRPQQMFEGIQDVMTHCLKADTAFTHTLTKNPLHPKWRVITNPVIYDLGDFLEYKGVQKARAINPLPDDLNAVIEGRNDRLFHTLRRWGYRAVHQFNDETGWHQEMQDKAAEINGSFSNPLPYKEVRDTAKASAKWIWNRRHTLGSRERVLEFTTETAQERMSQGALYTNATRTAKAIQTLQQSAEAMRLSGKPVTPLSLQAASGLNIKTVRKYLSHIR